MAFLILVYSKIRLPGACIKRKLAVWSKMSVNKGIIAVNTRGVVFCDWFTTRFV